MSKETIIPTNYLIYSIVISVIAAVIIWQFIMSDDSRSSEPLYEVIFGYFLFGFLGIFILRLSRVYNLNWSYLLGKFNYGRKSLKQLYIIAPLIGLSISGTYILYYVLASIDPQLIPMIETMYGSNLIYTSGENYLLANFFEFLLIVFIGPIIEEIYFRGLLLTSLAMKIPLKKSIIISSIIFSIYHIDLIGSFLFGIILSLIYINSKSLFIPILLHIGNNFIGYVIGLYRTLLAKSSVYSLDDLYSEGWLALLALFFSVTWCIYFYKKIVKKTKLVIPYLQY